MKLLAISVVLSSIISGSLMAQHKVRYGEDGRRNRSQISDKELLKISKSVVMLVDKSDLRIHDAETYKTYAQTLERTGYCSDQPFAKEVAVGWCSGFLVGQDTVVTAGHCIRSEFDCSRTAFIFDYTDNNYSGNQAKFQKSKVYNCSKIVSRSLNGEVDYAVLKLDRKVTDRSPMKLRESGKIKNRTKLAVLGHPEGIPLKVTVGGRVKRNSHPDIFLANLDTFGGNSGSAVISTETGDVEGILVAGVTDSRYSNSKGCMVVNKCFNSLILNQIFKRKKCTAPLDGKLKSGEQVVRIKHVLPYL